MDKIFACNPLSNTPLVLAHNRMAAFARFIDGYDEISFHEFIFDTGAIISTMSKSNAKIFGIYDKNIINLKASVGGFNKQSMYGRIISVHHLYIGIMGVKNTFFFIPDSDDAIVEVLGANVLNGLVPIPEFESNLIWIYKNKQVPSPYYSKSLGIKVSCEVLAQDEIKI
ncbi:MAG: hypothetical protein FWC09_03715 [Lachnospiraceae bacterium]|nr:hypothetical protein [Lachnospiraceae bacterium]